MSMEDAMSTNAAWLEDGEPPHSRAEDDRPNYRERTRDGGPPGIEKRSPWDLLNVRPDAPDSVIDVAYTFWRRRAGATEPAPGRRIELPELAEEAPEEPVVLRPLIRSEPALIAGAQANGAPAPDGPRSRLVAQDSGAHAIDLDGRPMRVGGDPTCDVVVGGARGGEEARIWLRDGRYFYHGIAASVNGQRIAWAVLEDGDVIEVGGSALRLELAPGR
jgi:hypothetical protein